MTSAPFHVEVYDKAFVRRGFLNDFSHVTMRVRHNRRSTVEIGLAADQVYAADVLGPGARVVARYTSPGGVATVVSGSVAGMRAEGPSLDSTVVVQVAGDWFDFLTWPVPGNALDAQSSAYYTATGAAETVIKNLVTANGVTRLGLPYTVAASLGRGSTVHASNRMEPAGDAIGVLADAGGIGVRVVQSGAGCSVDCYEGVDRTVRTLSEAGGTVVDWAWTSSAPTVTRVVVGGQGEEAARVFRTRADTTVESEWGIIREVFVDARDLAATGDLDARGDQAVADGAAVSGFTVTLSDTVSVAYGDNLAVGDLVRVETLPGVVRDDILREVYLTSTVGDGVHAVPVFGDPDTTDPTRVTAKAIANLAAAVRKLRAR